MNNFSKSRDLMVKQQVSPWDVHESQLLDLMATIPRELFTPEKYRKVAYSDTSIPLSSSAHMLPPKLVGRMVQAAEVKASDAVLEIGTGSAYMTVILGSLASQVDSYEVNPTLYSIAEQNLAKYSDLNITLHREDGAMGHEEHGPYDIIIASGAYYDIPSQLLHQLTVGGRLIAFQGLPNQLHLVKYQRRSGDNFHHDRLLEYSVDYLENIPKPTLFQF